MDGTSGSEAYAVLVVRQDGRWQLGVLPDAVTGDLDALIAAVRQQPGENGSFALVDVSDDDRLEAVWPAGDLGVFDDLGLDEREMSAIVSDLDAYADEMLSALAGRLGFSEPYERVVDALVE